MKRLLTRGVLYLAPLFVTLLAVFVVDPYWLFTSEETINESKFKISYSYDQGRRYKIFTYWNHPDDNIIIGASEINVLNNETLPEKGWHSLAYGGAPLQESLRMYWEVTKIHKLKKVLIAPEFIKYYNAIANASGDPYYTNFNWEISQSAKALSIYENKLDYFTDKYTLKSTWNYLVSSILPANYNSVPQMSKKEFWKSQMDFAHQVYDGFTVLDENKQKIFSLFEEIQVDANNNKTDIFIIIPVQHIELLKLEFQDSVYENYREYMKKLIEIFGCIYYYGYTDGVSDNDSVFSDPFHYISPKLYVNDFFPGHSKHILNKENVDSTLDNYKKIIDEYE